MFCKYCGKEIRSESAAFCPHCGRNISANITPHESPTAENAAVLENSIFQESVPYEPKPQAAAPYGGAPRNMYQKYAQGEAECGSGLWTGVLLFGTISFAVFTVISAVLYLISGADAVTSLSGAGSVGAIASESLEKLGMLPAVCGYFSLLIAAAGGLGCYLKERKIAYLIAFVLLVVHVFLNILYTYALSPGINIALINGHSVIEAFLMSNIISIISSAALAAYPVMLIFGFKKNPVLNVLLGISAVVILAQQVFYSVIYVSFLKIQSVYVIQFIYNMLIALCMFVCAAALFWRLKKTKRLAEPAFAATGAIVIAVLTVIAAAVCIFYLFAAVNSSDAKSDVDGSFETSDYEESHSLAEESETLTEGAETNTQAATESTHAASESSVPESTAAESGEQSAATSDTAIFEELSGISFSYSSGMGGWATTLEISEDGSFHGEYYDEDYSENSNGNITLNQYQCTFSGIFSTPEKISDWEYVMYLLNIETEEEPGTELSEPMDNFEYGNNWIKHVYTEPYGLENAYEIRIYLPQAPVSDLPLEFINWGGAFGVSEDSETLGKYGIYNVNDQKGFFGG